MLGDFLDPYNFYTAIGKRNQIYISCQSDKIFDEITICVTHILFFRDKEQIFSVKSKKDVVVLLSYIDFDFLLWNYLEPANLFARKVSRPLKPINAAMHKKIFKFES